MNKTLKHFIFTRFFCYTTRRYPIDIFDVDFLKGQLGLTNNVLRTLENQTNQNFELIFILHPKFFAEPKYEFIFSTLKNSTKLPLKFMENTGIYKNNGLAYMFKADMNDELATLLKDTHDKYDFVVTTRIDLDDFIHKNAVEEAQSKINECDSVLSYGYNKGYRYVYGELYPSFFHWNKGLGHHSIFQSLILKSSFAKKLPPFSVEDFNHPTVAPELKNFLEKNGLEYSDNMFQENNSINAFIYFGHELSQEHIYNLSKKKEDLSKPLIIPKKVKLTTADITKQQLKEEFGFTLELKSIKDKESEFYYDFNGTTLELKPIKDKESEFCYDFKSIRAEEFDFHQNLKSVKWIG